MKTLSELLELLVVIVLAFVLSAAAGVLCSKAFAEGVVEKGIACNAADATPKADAPKADAPKADAPKADAPKADAPKATHSFQVKTGKNVLLVKKGSAGWFESSISNRVFGTVHDNFITLKAGDSTKGNAFEKANCPEDKDFCEFEIHVRGEGKLVYGSLYNFFGQHVRIIKLFDIKLVNNKLQLVDVPNSVTLKIKD